MANFIVIAISLFLLIINVIMILKVYLRNTRNKRKEFEERKRKKFENNKLNKE